jgi:hypothetical protein
MDPQVPASFIPKRPLTAETRSRGGGGLIFILALLIFIISLVAGGATFLYEQYLKNSITVKAESLKRAEGAYDPGVIQDLVRLDARMNEARALLGKHVAPTALFTFLSGATLENVQFISFGYELQGDGSATISMGGVARSFSTVALQSDNFGASRVLRNVVFSDISVGETGAVTFSVSATVDPALLLYSKTLTQVSPTN